jgi:hypothetical protein
MQEHKSDYQQEQNDVSIKKVIQMRLYIFLISIVCCTGISRAQYNPQINELKWSDELTMKEYPTLPNGLMKKGWSETKRHSITPKKEKRTSE